MIKADDLKAWVAERATALGVPGVAVGVYQQSEELYAFHGVTSVENPLPVDEHTLFQFGSTGKTFTATAIMRLVEEGRVSLDEPVRTYVPELQLRDEQAARQVKVLHLLNHTAGWEGDLITSTGDGDDALARYVELLRDLKQVAPPGTSVSYNNAAFSLAGRIVEKVTGKVFEQAIKEMLFEPLGLRHSFFFPNEIMTRRFAVGHTQRPDGSVVVARPWALPRSGNPAGGISANAGDQIAWARFHLGDGRGPDGSVILSTASLKRMQEPTVELPGGALGDAIGIAWLLRDVGGVRLVSHGGTTNGQLSEFVMVPERDFAIISMTNCAPSGGEFNRDLLRWALETGLGIVEEEPEPVTLGEAELQQYAGTYETIAAVVQVSVEGGGLRFDVRVKPEMAAQLREAGEPEPPPQPPVRVGFLPGGGDRYVVTEGPAKGMRGYFLRDEQGAVAAVHVGGRTATRVAPAPAGV